MQLLDGVYEWLYGEPYSKPSPEVDDKLSPRLREATHNLASETTQFSAVLRRLSDHPDPLTELVRRISEGERDARH